MSKRHRHECGTGACGHSHSSFQAPPSPADGAAGRVAERLFADMTGALEAYVERSKEQPQEGAPVTAAALTQLRSMMSAYFDDVTTFYAEEEGKLEGTSTTALDAEAAAAAAKRHSTVELCTKLQGVRKQLKQWFPFGSLKDKEQVIVPKASSAFDSDVPSFDIDAFLYPEDDDVEDLCRAGHVSRNYCMDCKSTKIAPAQFVSHSFSRDQLAFLFNFALPSLAEASSAALSSWSIVDVGSRLGVVLAAAFYGTPMPRITGIEINAELCALQNRLVRAHRMTERVRVMQADVLGTEGTAALADASVVVLHNVFEWFCAEADQLAIWQRIRAAIAKKGQLIIASPPLAESLQALAAAFDPSFDAAAFISEWVEEVACEGARQEFLMERAGDAEDDDAADELDEITELIEVIRFYRVR